MSFLSFLAPLFFLISLSTLFVYLFNKKLRFEQVLPVSLMSVVLFFFFAVILFHNITLAFWLIIVAVLAGSIGFLVFDKNRQLTIKSLILTPGFLAFILLYVFIYVLNIGREATGWDEYMHWMPFVNDMLRVNDFYTSASNTAFVINGNYPPAISLFETLWVKLSGGMFIQSYLYNALQILCLSMLWPIFAKLSWGKKFKSSLNTLLITALVLIGVVSSILVLNLYDGGERMFTFFSSIYVDAALGCLLFYGFWLVFTRKDYSIKHAVIQLSIIATFLILAKEVGLAFAGIIIGYFLVDLLLNKEIPFNKIREILSPKNRTMVIVISLAILLPIAAQVGWNIQKNDFLSRPNNLAAFDTSKIRPFEIPGIFFNKSGADSQQESIRNFAKHFFSDPVPLNTDLIKITYPQASLLFLLIMIFIVIFSPKNERKRIIILTVTMSAGWLAYSFLLLNSYLFTFNDGERRTISLSDRYPGPYVLACIVMVLSLVIYMLLKQRKDARKAVGLIVLVVFLWGIFFNGVVFNSVIPYKLQPYLSIRQFSSPVIDSSKIIKDTVVSDKDFSYESSAVILLTCYNKATFEGTFLRYYIRPLKLIYTQDFRDFSSAIGLVQAAQHNQQIDSIKSVGEVTDHATSTYLISLCDKTFMDSYQTSQKIIDTKMPIKDKYQVFKYSKATRLFEPI